MEKQSLVILANAAELLKVGLFPGQHGAHVHNCVQLLEQIVKDGEAELLAKAIAKEEASQEAADVQASN